MMDLFALYKRNFTGIVRADDTVKRLLADPDCVVLTEEGGAAVVHKNCIRMLAVDAPYRGRGIGSRLLAEAEASVKARGYDAVVVGAGDGYITPGVPTDAPVLSGRLSDAAAFFAARGYAHSWGCECFDMSMDLADFDAEPEAQDVAYRWAKPEELPAIHACTRDAHPEFTKYYTSKQNMLVAVDGGEIVGALIVDFGGEAPDTGSVGCTAVKHSHRGRHIGVNLTIHGTRVLRDAGMKRAFLGYTYSGLDVMYGYAGYRICQYYFMAKKPL